MTYQIIHICGIPGTGKSTYAEWLEKKHGFIHLDCDYLFSELRKPEGFRKAEDPEKLELIKTFNPDDPQQFVRALRETSCPVVIDWGFPLWLIDTVRALQANGVVIWWFDGDRNAAEESFKSRGTVSLANFRKQMLAIEENWMNILSLVGSNVLEVIWAGPTYEDPERIFEFMFENR